jgi:hypothetical protein
MSETPTWVDGLIRWLDARVYRLRAVVPGVVDKVASTGDREQSIDVQSATPDLVAGEAEPADITPDTPMLNLTSGGFFLLMPVAAGDEVLGLCADRATGDWITTRTPGQVDEVNGGRAHVLSDMLALPFGISAPSGADAVWSGLVLGGPAGKAIELDDRGEIIITKQGDPIATITMDKAGSVLIEVAMGQSVNIGGPAALSLTKWLALETAVGALLDAGAAAVGSPADPAGENAGAAFALAKAAWELAIGVNSPETTKTKGE